MRCLGSVWMGNCQRQRQALDDRPRYWTSSIQPGKNKQELVEHSQKNPELVKQLQALAVEQATRLKENTLPLWRLKMIE